MEQLFSDFSSITAEEWKAQIEKDLKGADYQELFWNSPENIEIAPFYTKGKEGQPVFSHNDWSICESIFVESPSKANSYALEILNKGISHLIFRIDTALSRKELDILLKGIGLQYIRLDFKGVGVDEDFIKNYLDFLNTNYPNKSLDGTVHVSPFKRLLQNGHWHRSQEIDLSLLSKSHSLVAFGIRPLMIGGDLYHNAGANAYQQIAFMLAEISEYLYQLKSQNCENNLGKVTFEVGIGTNYFMEIAKLRALRILAKQIFESYGQDENNFHIYAETDIRNLSVFDPHVNLLRTTTQAMSAALGGCDSLRVRPFDTPFAYASNFSNRLARNVQLILKGESYFDKVADPAAGSYYIEHLTETLANKAWTLFQEIEADGGFLKCIKDGSIQQMIQGQAKRTDEDVANNKYILLGTNKYPNADEKMNERIQKFIFSDVNQGQDVTPIRAYRLSEEQEKERLSKEVEQA